ncbi:MAG: hypothetical protein KAI79_17385, partial [Bacteroidales bacterium]|nr:hypothetical protein [Bacteroidales bacterium]
DVERREKEKWHLKDKHKALFSTNDSFYNKKLTRFGVGSELDESVTLTYEATIGIPFYEEILLAKSIKEKSQNKICIFNHFDADNEIKEDVIYYIQALAKFTDIIFVSTAEGLSKESLKSIEMYCKDIIVKRNIGYDFGAWKTGLNYLGAKLNDYKHLILCNDSVYGPLFDLEPIFEKMQDNDVWSMTDNHEIDYHLQSYFMVYNKKAFSHEIFKTFWEDLKIYPNKQILIENNEIGFSKKIMQSALTYGSYYSCRDKRYINVLHYYWEDLITEHQFPFIKKELVKRNPLSLDIKYLPQVVSKLSQYNISIITKDIE